MASGMDDVDIIENYVVNSIIYNNCNNNNKVRGHTLVPSTNSSHSISCSSSNKSKELYVDRM